MTSIRQLDVLQLFRYLTESDRMPLSTYLGTVQFGTEAFHTDGKNVTFEAKGVEMNIQTPIQTPQAQESVSSGTSKKAMGWHCVLLAGAVWSTLVLPN